MTRRGACSGTRRSGGCVQTKGAVVGQGDSYQAALDDVRSAMAFHVETFGPDSILDGESPVMEALVAEATVAC